LYNDNRKATVVWGIGDSVKDAIECAQAFWTLMSVIAQQDEKNSPFYIALKHLNEGES
jgi:hypothetical protein